MHGALRTTLAAAVAAAVLAPAAAAAAPPTQGTGSRPWATVNVCDPPSRPAAVGVRAYVPRRGGAPAQWLRVRMEYWDADDRRWRRVREGGDGGWLKVGSGRRPVLGGTTFRFDEPPPDTRLVLRGVVDIEWRRGGRVVAEDRVRTTAGHRDRTIKVSLRSCEIAR